jgi:hypothetical protein
VRESNQSISNVAVAAAPSPYSAALAWSSRALIAATWVSTCIFGVYILMHYGGAIPAGKLPEWNARLSGLYDPTTPLATIGIGLHFAAGGILLLLGPLQFFAGIRARAPAIHRSIGWLYTVAAMIAGSGGLVYILAHGTIGGGPMAIGFAGYGLAVTLTAAQTLRHGRARRMDVHRAWAIRLFALAVGSWLYRMDYGFWVLTAGGVGHTPRFDGGFDFFMDFFFYVPNLLVAELFVRARGNRAGAGLRTTATVALGAATGFVLLATYFFTRYEWAPAIAARLSPAP